MTADNAPALLPKSVFRSDSGLFESMLSIDHDVPLLAMHFTRLVKGMHETGMQLPGYLNETFLNQEIRKIHEAEGIGKYAKVRFQVFRSANDALNFILETMPIDEEAVLYNNIGLKIGIVPDELKEIDGTEHLKRISPNLYTSVNDIIIANNWDDVLLMQDGYIMESGTSNIFWVKNGQIFTPPISAGCIGGVMRTYIIHRANELGYNILEEQLAPDILLAADEVFLTNAVRRIKWVKNIGNAVYSNTSSKHLYQQIFGI